MRLNDQYFGRLFLAPMRAARRRFVSRLRTVFHRLETVARRYGYRVTWVPPVLLQTPRTELSFEFEYAVAHLMLTKKDIFFVQIGANDGVSTDPLHKFVTEFGWDGILIEPLPDVFESLKANYCDRPNLQFINAAISKSDGARACYRVRRNATAFAKAHLFSSFDRTILARQTRWIPDITRHIEEVEVRCLSMASLQSHIGRRHVDILVIDTEGYDFEILKMIDFSRMHPSIVHFEHAHLTKENQNTAAAMLIDNGYRLVRDDLDTLAYCADRTYGWRYADTWQPHTSDAGAERAFEPARG